ncbi:MAG: hypothetical protein LBH90_05155 [Tannerella sp.]|jgi:hypothetical protein|nr:hypothetical protein [Tannerella sp.]
MIERDYIMRILQEFFNAIAKLIRLNAEDPDTSHIQSRFNDVYRQFFRRPAAHFYETEKDVILADLEKEGRSERDTLGKVQMLSELLYRDGLIKTSIPEKCMLLEKSLHLLDYLSRNSRTYSWDLGLKMADIKKLLAEFEIR